MRRQYEPVEMRGPTARRIKRTARARGLKIYAFCDTVWETFLKSEKRETSVSASATSPDGASNHSAVPSPSGQDLGRKLPNS